MLPLFLAPLLSSLDWPSRCYFSSFLETRLPFGFSLTPSSPENSKHNQRAAGSVPTRIPLSLCGMDQGCWLPGTYQLHFPWVSQPCLLPPWLPPAPVTVGPQMAAVAKPSHSQVSQSSPVLGSLEEQVIK